MSYYQCSGRNSDFDTYTLIGYVHGEIAHIKTVYNLYKQMRYDELKVLDVRKRGRDQYDVGLHVVLSGRYSYEIEYFALGTIEAITYHHHSKTADSSS